MNIFDMACYVLVKFSSPTQAITPLKLQKMLYYIKAWSLVAGYPLLPEPFLKWKYGPGYQLDFYADLSGNGEYDAPPTDHAWRLVLQPFTGDTLVFFTYDTNFTDIGFPASLTDAQEFETPEDISLYQNYPNPFNPSTKIKFQIPNSKFTTLKVYNILGKEVAEIVANNLSAGVHQYQFDGRNLATGVYYYQIVAGKYREMKKMILLR